MRNWLISAGIGLACMVLSWALLVVLARRLPPGVLRDLAARAGGDLRESGGTRRSPDALTIAGAGAYC